MLHVNCTQEPHTNLNFFTFYTQFLKENDQNSTWKTLHVSQNIVYSKIFYKHIHIMGSKNHTSKEIVYGKMCTVKCV